MQNSTKEKITSIIRDYKILFPDDYTAFCEYIKENRKTLRDEYATVYGNHIPKRVLFSVSELLSGFLVKELSQEQMMEFRTLKGSRWFAKTFKEFAHAERI